MYYAQQCAWLIHLDLGLGAVKNMAHLSYHFVSGPVCSGCWLVNYTRPIHLVCGIGVVLPGLTVETGLKSPYWVPFYAFTDINQHWNCGIEDSKCWSDWITLFLSLIRFDVILLLVWTGHENIWNSALRQTFAFPDQPRGPPAGLQPSNRAPFTQALLFDS